jgi:hypothetical protein
VEPLAVPRHPSSPQIPELRTSTASKLRDFPQFRETSFFGEYSPSLNSASFFFFLFIHYEEENQAAFFIGEFSKLDEFFLSFSQSPYFFKNQNFLPDFYAYHVQVGSQQYGSNQDA